MKPDYTEEARRRAISGDVVLEIVVRSDGRVGDVKVLPEALLETGRRLRAAWTP